MSKYQTRQRRQLLDYLEAHADRQLSAREIARDLGDGAVSLSAVYRNLGDLELEGKLRRSSRESSREVYYQYLDAAPCRGVLHLSCKNCGRTLHLREESAERLRALLLDEGFQLDQSETLLVGLCRDCR